METDVFRSRLNTQLNTKKPRQLKLSVPDEIFSQIVTHAAVNNLRTTHAAIRLIVDGLNSKIKEPEFRFHMMMRAFEKEIASHFSFKYAQAIAKNKSYKTDEIDWRAGRSAIVAITSFICEQSGITLDSVISELMEKINAGN
jgi:hypothetical protein